MASLEAGQLRPPSALQGPGLRQAGAGQATCPANTGRQGPSHCLDSAVLATGNPRDPMSQKISGRLTCSAAYRVSITQYDGDGRRSANNFTDIEPWKERNKKDRKRAKWQMVRDTQQTRLSELVLAGASHHPPTQQPTTSSRSAHTVSTLPSKSRVNGRAHPPASRSCYTCGKCLDCTIRASLPRC